MMLNKDVDMLVEAYNRIYEAPIDPGAEWNTPTADIAVKMPEPVKKMFAQYGLPDTERQIKAIDAVKNFLAQHENSHYPGTYKEFRNDIVKHIVDATGINMTKGKYISRVIQNVLSDRDGGLGVISIKDGGVTVGSVDKLDDKKAVLDTEVPVPVEAEADAPVVHDKFKLDAEYTVNALAAEELPRIEKELSEYIDGEMSGEDILYVLKNSLIFRNANTAGGMDGDENALKHVLTKWVKTGVLDKVSSDSNDKEVAVLDAPEDNKYDAGDYLKSRGIHVPTSDIWTGHGGE